MSDAKFFIESIWFDSNFEENNDQLVADIINSSGPVVLFLLWEAFNPANGWGKRLNSLTTKIKLKNPDRPVILIINSWYQPYSELKQIKSIDDIVYLDFFLLLVYHRLVVCKESELATTWNPDTKKFLFLTGKPSKIQRIRLLYKFAKNQLLSDAVWSLFYQDTGFKESREFVPELTDVEYKKFFFDHCCNPDGIDIIENTGSLHYSGIPYNSIIYRNCDFQVISETNYSEGEWINEKTWLSIINRRPFIIAGDTGTLKKLNDMGFRTFEKYLKISDYDCLHDPEQRLDSIVVNTLYWLENIQEYQKEISQDIEHNFKKILELANLNLQNIQGIINKYKLESTPEKLIPLYDTLAHAQWKEWYQRVRDPSWPDCKKEKDFFQLPNWIQKELIEVFNYKPKKST
jgi:hypothetical protein